MEEHARRIYAGLLNPGLTGAKELLKHLKKGDLSDGFTIRDIYNRKAWAGLSTKEDAERATEFLCDTGWLRPAGVNLGIHGGRPTTHFEMHPCLTPST